MDYTPVSLVARPYYGTPKTIGLFSNHTFLWKNDDTLIDDNFFCSDTWSEEIIW